MSSLTERIGSLRMVSLIMVIDEEFLGALDQAFCQEEGVKKLREL